MVRSVATFAAVFVGVLVVLLIAVGQLGKIDRQTLVVVLVVSAAAGTVGVWRRRRAHS